MSAAGDFAVRAVTAADRPRVAALLATRWGGRAIVVHDEVIDASELPGYLAEVGTEVVGLITYRVAADRAEVISLDSLQPGMGIGTALLAQVETKTAAWGCREVWLVTTNDNLEALRFYQRRGYRLIGVDRGAVDRARAIKPTIPWRGAHGIPIRDELLLAKALGPGSAAGDAVHGLPGRPDSCCHRSRPAST